jgi:putative heme iron utilization protein
MPMEAQELAQLARLIRGQRWAALGTVTRQAPLASMVAYAPEPDFSGFLMHLSQLSRHTKNLLANPHASLAISEPETGAENPQTLVRVSIQGKVDSLLPNAQGYAEAAEIYKRHLPASVPLFDFEDFILFRLVPREARYIAGFARAYTVSAAKMREAAATRSIR